MIGHDEPMALVVMDRDIVKSIFYLDHANLESGEYDKLALLAESKGFGIYLTNVSEVSSFVSLYSLIGELSASTKLVTELVKERRPTESCKCGEEGQEESDCPYNEISGSEHQCNCCSGCRQECRDAI